MIKYSLYNFEILHYKERKKIIQSRVNEIFLVIFKCGIQQNLGKKFHQVSSSRRFQVYIPA